MSRTLSEDEVLDGYVRSMGSELGELFHALSNDLQWTHLKWSQYRALFGDNETRVGLLNEAAPFFFRVVQDVFFEDTLLAIARLVGPVETYKKPNLAIQRLPPLMTTTALTDVVQRLVNDAKSSAEFAVDWRNRHLAHRDLSLALNRTATPLPEVSRKNVEDALASLDTLFNHIQGELCHSTTLYRNPPLHSDAVDLLYVIRDGLAHEKLRHESELQGHPLADNITNQEPI